MSEGDITPENRYEAHMDRVNNKARWLYGAKVCVSLFAYELILNMMLQKLMKKKSSPSYKSHKNCQNLLKASLACS